jgi:hypothetical protein
LFGSRGLDRGRRWTTRTFGKASVDHQPVILTRDILLGPDSKLTGKQEENLMAFRKKKCN